MKYGNDITIPLEEYKELLIIKGKYEELKEQQQPIYTGIRFNGNPIYTEYDNGLKEPYKITCGVKE